MEHSSTFYLSKSDFSKELGRSLFIESSLETKLQEGAPAAGSTGGYYRDSNG